MNWLGENRIPFVIAYTKTDRVLPKILKKNIQAIQEEFLKYWETLPQQFITSAERKRGREEILKFVEEGNQYFYSQSKWLVIGYYAEVKVLIGFLGWTLIFLRCYPSENHFYFRISY